MTTVTLVIPSYGRAVDLGTALDSALRQTEPFDEIIVVARVDDSETITTAQGRGVTITTVSEAGVLAAMQAGARLANSEIVAFTDDDARLPTDHASRLRTYFDDPSIDGVGGRDVIYDQESLRATSLTTIVGQKPPSHVGGVEG